MDTQTAVLLKIYIGESDRHHGKPLYKYILEYLRENDIAGATVFRGLSGYGKTSVIHTSSIVRLSTDLPILIEVVDSREKIDSIRDELLEIMDEGLITEEKINVIFYQGNKAKLMTEN